MRLAATKPKVREADPLDQMAAPLLRPRQVEEMQEQAKRLDRSIRAAGQAYGGTSSVGDTRRALSRVKQQLDAQAPRKYAQDELDDAVAAEKVLREEIQAGMPTGEEMRKNPPGAVGKHMTWEKRNKRKIQAWQNIRLRLRESGALPDSVDSRDVSNVELLRRHSSSHQLSMDGAQIAGAGKFYFPDNIEPRNIMSDEEREAAEAGVQAIMRIFRETKDPEKRKAAIARLTEG